MLRSVHPQNIRIFPTLFGDREKKNQIFFLTLAETCEKNIYIFNFITLFGKRIGEGPIKNHFEGFS